METITNAVNAVSSTVTNTIWGSTDSQNETPQQEEQKKVVENPAHPTFGKKELASLDRYPSVMGTATPPPDASYDTPDATTSGLANLSLKSGADDSKIEMSHDQTGYPFVETSKEEVITGTSTGNSATLIDAGGSADRGLEGADPRKNQERHNGHKRNDSGVHGLDPHEEPAHQIHAVEKGEDGISRGTVDESRKTSHLDRSPQEIFGVTTNDDGIRRSAATDKKEDDTKTNSGHESENHPSPAENQGRSTEHHKTAPNTQQPTHDPKHGTTSAESIGRQREGSSSANEPSSQGNPSTTNTSILPMGEGLSSKEVGRPGEPSVGAKPSSAAQPTQKQHGADRPKEAPEKGSEGSTSQGTGEEYVETTGTAAEGGDFDATKPGAGKEADRLLEQAGVHRSAPGGKAGVPPNEGHKYKHLLGKKHEHDGEQTKSHVEEHNGDHHTTEGDQGKKSLGEKIKEKLHLRKEHH